MRVVLIAVILCTFGEGEAFADPPTVVADGALRPGKEVILSVRQVITNDGLSRGERMLNGLHPLQAGDMFTAELNLYPGQPAIILAGCVEEVTPPRRFGRPGTVSVKLAWPFDTVGDQQQHWRLDVEDQRFTSKQKRRAITTLFLAEGFVLGASVGSNLDRGKSAATLGAGGVGLALGVAYASLQPGQEASLEPGDKLCVVVGMTDVKKLPPEVPLVVYPAHEPEEENHEGKSHMKGRHTMEKSR